MTYTPAPRALVLCFGTADLRRTRRLLYRLDKAGVPATLVLADGVGLEHSDTLDLGEAERRSLTARASRKLLRRRFGRAYSLLRPGVLSRIAWRRRSRMDLAAATHVFVPEQNALPFARRLARAHPHLTVTVDLDISKMASPAGSAGREEKSRE
ncbi:hypothetical protein [Salininema proteolyticum]|uniref:Uncharacterized protein n=1 Tax=Salininema proteolyticum TaxID=1607685 RepID=A0ABV8U278_9ACTN